MRDAAARLAPRHLIAGKQAAEGDVTDTLMRFQCNQFGFSNGVPSADTSFGASAVYAFISRVNHSCAPSMAMASRRKYCDAHGIEYSPAEENGAIVAYAVRDLQPGEALTFNYAASSMPEPASVPLAARRDLLRRGLGFTCMCVRCVADEAAAVAMAQREPAVNGAAPIAEAGEVMSETGEEYTTAATPAAGFALPPLPSGQRPDEAPTCHVAPVPAPALTMGSAPRAVPIAAAEPSAGTWASARAGYPLVCDSCVAASSCCSGVDLSQVLAGGFAELRASLPEGAALAAEMASLRDGGHLIDSMGAGFSIVNGRFEDAATRGRSDHHMRLSEAEALARGLPAIAAAVRLLRGIAAEVSRDSGRAELTASPQVQIACYPGNGACYRRHQDVSSDARGRSNWRVATIVAYVNPQWDSSNGGALRLYDATRVSRVGATDGAADGQWRSFWDVAPQQGTVVVFDAALYHEVMPVHGSSRFAITLWVWCEDGDAEKRILS